MYRYEEENVFIRYDGTETLININISNRNQITIDKLKEIISVLDKAVKAREEFEKVEELCGEDFMMRLKEAVKRPPYSKEVLDKLGDGPEYCGGIDADPDD